jgi:protein gp37
MVPAAWLKKPLSHVWFGTSVENQATADERIPHLLQVPAAVRFLSCEPLLGSITLPGFDSATAWCPVCTAIVPCTLARWHSHGHDVMRAGPHCSSVYDLIHWVIAGGESGPGHRPMDTEWARSLRDQCRMAGVPFFFKQASGLRPGQGEDALGEVVQEFPHGRSG